MKANPFRAFAAALALIGLALSPSAATAEGRLDIRSWIDRPGVKVVAVEFYATWCKPCMASVPRWKALHEKYRDDGFRLIVINTLDPGGGCSQVPWNPDHRICDDDGFVGTSFGVGGNLPAAFLWSWQGDLLVKKGHIDTVEQEVERYLRKNPRVSVEALGADGQTDDALEAMVRAEIQMSGKFDVVVGKEERRKLAELRKASHAMAARQDQHCKVGATMSANSMLSAKVLGKGTNQKLALSLNSAETGCLLATNWAGFNTKRPSQSVREAVVGLIDKLRKPPEHPKGGRFGGASAPTPSTTEVKEGSIGGDEAEWDPSGAAASQSVVKLRSNPPGAVVFVDGRLFCKSTPCSKAMDIGRHNIDMQLSEYMPKREVVDIKGSESLVWDLLADFALVKVETTPPNIPVSVDGRERKPGELASLKLAEGPHEFIVEGRCFYKAGERVVVKRGETRTVTIAPKARPSGIKVSAVDDKGNDLAAKVFVDGKLLEGETPRVFPVPVCSQKVRVEAAGLGVFETALNLEEKQVQPVNAILKPAVANLLGSISGLKSVGGLGLKGAANPTANNLKYAAECAKGVSRSCNWLGLAYHNGTGVPKNQAMALKLFTQACQMGYKVSCYNAGNAHKNGWGTVKDPAAAGRVYRTGCDKGDDGSCNELGMMYHYGHGGLPQDKAAALRLFEKSCSLGSKVSCGNAGNAYKNGWGTSLNLITAGSRYNKGCTLGNGYACNEYGILLHFGRGYSKNQAQALTLFRRACDLGNGVSCGNVGNAYKNGWGTSRNTYEAKRWYKKACAKGQKSGCTEAAKL